MMEDQGHLCLQEYLRHQGHYVTKDTYDINLDTYGTFDTKGTYDTNNISDTLQQHKCVIVTKGHPRHIDIYDTWGISQHHKH